MKQQTDEDKRFNDNLDKLVRCRNQKCRHQTVRAAEARRKFRNTQEKKCGNALDNPRYFVCRDPEPASLQQLDKQVKACTQKHCRSYEETNEAFLRKEKKALTRRKKLNTK